MGSFEKDREFLPRLAKKSSEADHDIPDNYKLIFHIMSNSNLNLPNETVIVRRKFV